MVSTALSAKQLQEASRAAASGRRCVPHDAHEGKADRPPARALSALPPYPGERPA